MIICLVDEDLLIDDMMLNQEQIRLMKSPPGSSNAREGLRFRWDGGEMPYIIDHKTIKSQMRIKRIENAVATFNKRLCGCFYIRYGSSE